MAPASPSSLGAPGILSQSFLKRCRGESAAAAGAADADARVEKEEDACRDAGLAAEVAEEADRGPRAAALVGSVRAPRCDVPGCARVMGARSLPSAAASAASGAGRTAPAHGPLAPAPSSAALHKQAPWSRYVATVADGGSTTRPHDHRDGAPARALALSRAGRPLLNTATQDASAAASASAAELKTSAAERPDGMACATAPRESASIVMTFAWDIERRWQGAQSPLVLDLTAALGLPSMSIGIPIARSIGTAHHRSRCRDVQPRHARGQYAALSSIRSSLVAAAAMEKCFVVDVRLEDSEEVRRSPPNPIATWRPRAQESLRRRKDPPAAMNALPHLIPSSPL
jgi:hypothetical protein